MKQIIFIALVLVCAFATGFTQVKPPVTVTTAFSQKFPKVTKVQWDKENAHEYEAEFKLNGANYSANFTDKGEWVETESPVLFTQLPEKVQAAFNASHKGATVKAISKIEPSKGVTKYEVEIKQGSKTVELFYTAEGRTTKE